MKMRTFSRTASRLIEAINKNDVKWLKKQLEGGASVNTWRDFETDNSMLHRSLQCGNPEITRLLVKHGADLQHANKNGERALDVALLSGRVDHARILLSSGDRADIEMLGYLKQQGLDKEARLFYEFIDLCDWNVDGLSILHLAVTYGDREGALMVLTRGAQVNERTPRDGLTALHLAAKANDFACIDVLLKHGADPSIKDEQGYTALHNVVRFDNDNLSNQLLVIQMLLEAGVNVDEIDDNGTTALFLAASNANAECTEFLLSKGASPNIRTFCNRTPLYALVQSCKADEARIAATAKVLLDGGATINEACEGVSWTALHMVARRGFNVCAELLLQYGADTNACDKRGYTPLHVLVSAKDIDIVAQLRLAQILLEHGADVNLVAKDGETTVLHCAWMTGARAIAITVLRHVSLEKARKWIRDSVMLIDKPCCGFEAYGGAEYGLQRHLLRLILEKPYWTYFYAECDSELWKMQYKWLSEKDKLTYFNFITEDAPKIHTGVASLEEIIKDPALEETFPIYCKSLKRKLYTMVEDGRRRAKAISRLTSIIGRGDGLSDKAAQKIIDYLGPKDVRSFTTAIEPFVVKTTYSGFRIDT